MTVTVTMVMAWGALIGASALAALLTLMLSRVELLVTRLELALATIDDGGPDDEPEDNPVPVKRSTAILRSLPPVMPANRPRLQTKKVA